MATTEQRSGFRLPWASDARSATSSDAPQASAVDASPNNGTSTESPETPEATTMQETTTTPETTEPAWPEFDRLQPEATAGESPAAQVQPAPDATPVRSRRDNPLVANLVRAMRDAAGVAREEAAARFADEAKGRIERIHSDAADEATALREQSEADIVEIKDWSKAEMARIREETDKRIASRRTQLEAEVEDHAARVERRIDHVQGAVSGFQKRMDEFFEVLLAEEDPARLAALAEQLPEPPSLEGETAYEPAPVGVATPTTTDEPAFPTDVLDARIAAAAEAEAFAGLDDAGVDDMADASGEEIQAIEDSDVVRRLDAFTGHEASQAEAAVTQLSVVGLVSVASIAGFKRALAKVAGVRNVTVASGSSGDFVFTVNHDPEADVRSAIPALPGFSAEVSGDADGIVTVTATDPEGAH